MRQLRAACLESLKERMELAGTQPQKFENASSMGSQPGCGGSHLVLLFLAFANSSTYATPEWTRTRCVIRAVIRSALRFRVRPGAPSYRSNRRGDNAHRIWRSARQAPGLLPDFRDRSLRKAVFRTRQLPSSRPQFRSRPASL